MAEAQVATTEKKKRKAQGPRKEKPFYVVATYTNEAGEVQILDKSRLSVSLIRNPAELASLVLGGGAQVSFAIEVAAPVAPKAAAAA